MDYKADFLDYLQYHRNLSENTLHSYGFDLREFLQWINQREVRPEDVKLRDIDAFIIWLKKKGNKVQSVNRKAYALKTFYRFLLRNEVVQKNPLEFFENIKGPKLLPHYLTREQQEGLLKAAKEGNTDAPWIDARNHLVVLLLIDSGLRISELCNLQMKDINLGEGVLRVLGKGSKEREVILSDRVQAALREFLGRIEKIEFQGDGIGPGLASRGLTMGKVGKEMGKSNV